MVAQSDSLLVHTVRASMARAMSTLHVPGGAWVLVRDGRPLAIEAAGVADVEAHRPVSVDATVFRIASVSKVFTAMAVLQQRERLPLDADMAARLPEVRTSGSPLTLRQLLTHTAGLDEHLIGYLAPLTAPTTAPMPSLADVVREAHPTRVRDDRRVPGYSNLGTAAAALMVERTTHQPFDRYVDSALFAPLAMRATHFVVPGRVPSGDSLAAEYRYSGARPLRSYSPSYPAGNIGTTARDMSRLLVAWERGELPGLDAASHALLDRALEHEPGMPPMGLARSGWERHGVRVYIKGGASRSHSAVIATIPGARLALFVAVNRQEPQVWEQVLDALTDSVRRWQPAPPTDSAVPALAVDGHFRWTRTPVVGAERVLAVASEVTAHAMVGGVRLEGAPLAGDYIQRGARRFVRDDGETIVARVDADGAISHLFGVVQGQPVSLERIAWFDTASFALAVMAAAFMAGLMGALAGTWRARRGVRGATSFGWHLLLLWLYVLLPVAGVAGAAWVARDAEALALGARPSVYAALTATTLWWTAATAVALRSLWVARAATWRARAGHLMLACTASALALTLVRWGLAGWRL